MVLPGVDGSWLRVTLVTRDEYDGDRKWGGGEGWRGMARVTLAESDNERWQGAKGVMGVTLQGDKGDFS